MARMGRVNVPLDKDMRKQIQKWAASIRISESDFCRRLVVWGFKHYSRNPTFLFSGLTHTAKTAASREKR